MIIEKTRFVLQDNYIIRGTFFEGYFERFPNGRYLSNKNFKYVYLLSLAIRSHECPSPTTAIRDRCTHHHPSGRKRQEAL